MLQMRLSPGGRWYSPSRDLAYTLEFFVKFVVQALHPSHRSELTSDLIKRYGLSDDELKRGCESLVKFCTILRSNPAIDFDVLLNESGFAGLPDGVKVAIGYSLGRALLGASYTSIQQAFGSSPSESDSSLMNEIGRLLNSWET